MQSVSQLKVGPYANPKCECCNHPVSFHRSKSEKCGVVGCECARWVPARESLSASV